MNLGAQEVADFTFLYADKGKWFSKNHKIPKYNILASGTVYEAGYCMRRKRYSQTRKYQNKNTTQEHEDNLDRREEEKEKRKKKKKGMKKKKIKPTNLFK